LNTLFTFLYLAKYLNVVKQRFDRPGVEFQLMTATKP
jgi:hypothetical protein